MTIAERIKRLRELFGITANDLAKITGIHPVSIRKYETNKMVPGIEVIDKMCDALKLPRMIFEGFPKQHTDYQFTGDFYQQLFLLLENNTLESKDSGKYNFLTGENDYLFTINQKLTKYITVKQGEKTIPLNELSFTINTEEIDQAECYNWLIMYLRTMENVHKAQESDNWINPDSETNEFSSTETKDEYIARQLESAEKLRFDLMLTEHNWKQYMNGWGSKDEAISSLNDIIASGGNYYEYVEQLDAPEAEKEKLIHAYENAYISELVQLSEYPDGQSVQKRIEWANKKIELISQYKKEHPDYPLLSKQHAIEEAEKARTLNKSE